MKTYFIVSQQVDVTAEDIVNILVCLSQGRTVDAIRDFRTCKGCSLLEAKNYVDSVKAVMETYVVTKTGRTW